VHATLLAIGLAGVLALCGAERAAAQVEVSYECTPAPVDCSGWYRSNVRIDWTVLPTTGTSTVGCHDRMLTTDTPGSIEFCRGQNGNSSDTREVTITIDKTPPVVTGGQPARGADFNGWYNHPVAIAFSGSDLTSGIDSCTAPTYGGPDSGAAAIFGTCVDKAGNVSAPFGYGLSYDATAPAVLSVKATTGDRRVNVRWRAASDVAAIEVVRTPGLGNASSSIVFQGSGGNFEDTDVRNGERYVYTVRVRDAAGNWHDLTVVVRPHPHLLSPSRLAEVKRRKPPVLRWTPVMRASYYNVQLFRDGRKVLSVWPTKARYQLKKRWTYAGKRRRLVPGKYRWLVWPGFGRRSKTDYGEPLGPRYFRVAR
jgi:hypothetical protein